MVSSRLVAVSDRGYRLGDSHPQAKLTNADVDRVHELREAGLSLAHIAGQVGASKSAVAHILSGRRRAEIPVAWVAPGTRCAPMPIATPKHEGATLLQQVLREAWR